MITWRDARAGARAVFPALPANIPFGLVAGVAAVDVGFSGFEGVLLSGLWFAGAAQLAAIDLLEGNAPLAIVLVTALVVNARYVMYSGAIAPYFREFPRPMRWVASFFLLDVTFALAVTEFESERARDDLSFYLGAAVPLWGLWTVATAVGVLVGTRIPPAWGIDFAIPLVFLALLAPSIEGRASIAAAAIGGLGATIGAGIPLNLGLIVAALCGIVGGLLVDEWGDLRG